MSPIISGGGGASSLSSRRVVVSSGALATLDTTLVELVAAPGAGFVLAPVAAFAQYKPGALAFVGNPTFAIGVGTYAGSPGYPGIQSLNLAASALGMTTTDPGFGIFLQGAAGIGTAGDAATITEVTNQPIQLGGNATAMTAGNGSLVVTVSYAVVALVA